MKLKDIFTEILSIASEIENNTLSYSLAPLVKAGKKKNPADLLTGIAARFSLEITHNITPDKQKVKIALMDLKKIAKDKLVIIDDLIDVLCCLTGFNKSTIKRLVIKDIKIYFHYGWKWDFI